MFVNILMRVGHLRELEKVNKEILRSLVYILHPRNIHSIPGFPTKWHMVGGTIILSHLSKWLKPHHTQIGYDSKNIHRRCDYVFAYS